MHRSNQDRLPTRGIAVASLEALLGALPFAAYGLARDMTVLYNNGRHALHDFLADEGGEMVSPEELVGSNLLDHVPVSEREPLRKLVQETVRTSSADSTAGPKGADFLHASASGLQRLRVLATRIPGEKGELEVLLTCHEGPVNTQHIAQSAAGSARLDVARQLAATLNHEINNPLFIVSATLEDLLAETSDPAAQRRLRAALDAVWRVASAVKQLQEIRHVVTTAYIEGLPMVDLDASSGAERNVSQR